MNLLFPKVGTHALPPYPLFYLGGPIRGANDCQARATHALDKHYGGRCIIASPCRYDQSHPLFQHRLPQDGIAFKRQVLWERHYMRLAASWPMGGCLIFWLPLEDPLNPRPKEEGPYGQDTYGEIPRWSVEKKYDPKLRMVIGAEKGYFGLSQIKVNLDEDLGMDFPIYETLEETLRQAIAIAA